MTASQRECPPDLMSDAVRAARSDDQLGLNRVETLLRDYALDPRLHFLRGSLLAGRGAIGEAHEAMRLAVAIAPSYQLARYQLGFLELTSGDVAAARETWRPLLKLPADHPLHLFVRGLELLAADAFDESVEQLRAGMAVNAEFPAINGDLTLLISRIQSRDAGPSTSQAEPLSAAHLLLQQYATRPTKH